MNDIKKVTKNNLDSRTILALEDLIKIYEKENFTIDQIVENISDMLDITRASLHIIAIANKNNELADKIQKANEIVTQNKINAFKESVKNGTYKEFLQNMSWSEISALKIDMNLSRMGFPDEEPLSEEEQMYSDIIEESINNELLKKEEELESSKPDIMIKKLNFK